MIRKKIERENLQKTVGKMLMPHFYGELANEESRYLLQEVTVGGIILYNWSNGLHSKKQVMELTRSLKEQSPDLLIAIDQEGGRVQRLYNGFSPIPSASSFNGDEKAIERAAYQSGKEMREVGIDLNFAPVVDIKSPSTSSVIGDRSYGESPKDVIRCARAAISGYHRAGIMTCLKHFPGHGEAQEDSHLALPVVNKSREAIDRHELLPFQKLLHETDAIMSAHLRFPLIDNRIATLSPKILRGILRGEWGFKGRIISDSLVMRGVLPEPSKLIEVATEAVIAGCDLLLLGGRQSLSGEESYFECSPDCTMQLRDALTAKVEQKHLSLLG